MPPGTNAQVRVLVSNPSAVHVETRRAAYVVSGIGAERLADEIDESSTFDAVVRQARNRPGEFSIVAIDEAAVRAFRSLTSTYDVFFCRRPEDDAIVVGDHFRDVLSTIPASARTVPESVAVDQLLFGTRPNATYVGEVGRLGHGERLVWTRGGAPEIDLVDTLSTNSVLGPRTATSRLDRYLADVCGEIDGASTTTMLSGGVDSVLLHTYLDTDSTVNGAFDSPEFQFEDAYARTASGLLGSDHEGLTYHEADYLSHLEATIDATGQPVLLPQAALMYLVFRDSPHDVYVNGALADGVFGTGITALAYLSRYLGRGSRVVPSVSWEVQKIKETADALRRPATSVDGCAMGFRIHADERQVASIYGQAAVDDRKRHRLRYTQSRVPTTDEPGYAAHMHLGHCIEYFHDVIVANWRHAAHACGTSLVVPFAGRDPLDLALAIPPERRYARFARPTRRQPTHVVSYKYLLKDLLRARLPEYDTAKPKGHGLLPFQRYLRDGPLSDVFDVYSVPDFVPREHRELVRTGSEELSWYAANYAIWRDRILENDDLGVFETTTVIEG